MNALTKSYSLQTRLARMRQYKSRCDRLASVTSAFMMLVLTSWMVIQALPRDDQDSLANLPKPTLAEHSIPRAQVSAARPAVAAVILPPPPRPSKPRIETKHSVKSVGKVLAPITPGPIPSKSASEVRPLRPTEKAAVSKPVIAALRSVEPPSKIEVPPVKKTLVSAKETEPQPKLKQASEHREVDAAQPKPKTLREGRALLRVLEHGAGPTIEIAWPDTRSARRQLFNRFTDCFGMRIALMRPDGKLFIADGRSGESWEINLDRHSGFVRQPAGQLASKERNLTRRIRAHHPRLFNASPVRIFPRRVDAMLLAGLKQISGKAYAKESVIHARYRVAGRRVVVEHVTVNGRSMPGQVDLLSAAQICREDI
jgi:hypothetical protein